jgi:hypothetical protein
MIEREKRRQKLSKKFLAARVSLKGEMKDGLL